MREISQEKLRSIFYAQLDTWGIKVKNAQNLPSVREKRREGKYTHSYHKNPTTGILEGKNGE